MSSKVNKQDVLNEELYKIPKSKSNIDERLSARFKGLVKDTISKGKIPILASMLVF